MSEKVKVPKWFDEWYKSFDKPWGEENDVRLYYISRIGFGFLFHDGEDKEMPIEYFDYVYENRERLIRAIFDGYEIEQEYIEVSPVRAYEFFFNKSFEVYCKYEGESKYHSVTTGDFIPADIIDFNKKFYIKKEEKYLEKATFFNIHSNYTDLSFGKEK